MPPSALKTPYLAVEDYLSGERDGEVRHEYVDGAVHAMARVSLRHNLISGNVYGLLWNQLRDAPCYPLTGDMLTKTDKSRYRYPDVFVACADDPSNDEYVRESPILIIEVLSHSTRRRDKTEKRAEYLALPSLLEYVLIEQEFAEVEIQRRSQGWRSEYFYLGEEVTFESVGVTVAVEEIYRRVENEDVRVFLEGRDKLLS